MSVTQQGRTSFVSSVPETPAVIATGTNGADGMKISSEGGAGVALRVSTVNNFGIFSESESGTTISGVSPHGIAVAGTTETGIAGDFHGNVFVSDNLFVTGNLSVSGTKAFVQAHPTDPEREIVYIALEGGEAGTYVRGSGQLQSGKAVLALPEHFGLVTENSGLTVQLTPRGQWLQLYVVELDTAQLVVREAQGKSGVFDYLIQGVRRGSEPHEVIRTKR